MALEEEKLPVAVAGIDRSAGRIVGRVLIISIYDQRHRYAFDVDARTRRMLEIQSKGILELG